MTEQNSPRPDTPDPGLADPDAAGGTLADSDSGAAAGTRAGPERAGKATRGGTTSTPDSWMKRRRTKIAAEIARNRRGEYTVPTWVLTAALAVIVGAWLAVIFFS